MEKKFLTKCFWFNKKNFSYLLTDPHKFNSTGILYKIMSDV